MAWVLSDPFSLYVTMSQLIIGTAMQCGFEDSNYFSVVFSREVGMTPGQWRHRSRVAA